MENNSQEVWRPIDGFEGLYEVSSEGRVRSCDRYVDNGNGSTRLAKGRVLKPQKNHDGYHQLLLYKDGKPKMFYVHRLVAKEFPEICGECKENLDVEHKNCIRADNRAENLRWCTHKENCCNELSRKNYSNANKGKENVRSKPVIQYSLIGKKLSEFDSLMEAERKTGIKHQLICEVLKGRCKQTHGFIFRYKTA